MNVGNGWKRIFRCSAVLVVLALSACKVERPDTVLPDDKMEDILYDYHIARAMGEEIPYNESYKRVLYIDEVFRKHGITEAQFDTSMVWFSRNPTVIADIYERVNKRLKAQRDRYNSLIAIRDNRPKMSPAGDSVDVWVDLPLYQLTGTPFNNKLTFALVADTNYHARDTLKWTARFRYLEGMGTDTIHLPVMALQVEYKTDTVLDVLQRVKRPGTYVLSLSADTLGAIKEVRGFVYYPIQSLPRTLTIDRVSLMRFHATDSLYTEAAVDSVQAPSSSSSSTVAPKVQKEKTVVKPAIPARHDSDELPRENRPVRLEKRNIKPL